MSAISPESMQNAIFVNPATNIFTGTSLTALNVAGYGAAFVSAISLPTGVTLPANQSIGFKFISSYPPPLYSFAAASASLQFKIFTNDNAELQPTAVVNTVPAALDGFSNVYFQPGAAEGYSVIIRNISATAITAGSVLMYIQATIQNTIGQFLQPNAIMPAASTSDKDIEAGAPPTKITVSAIVGFNSNSAVPNCYAIKVENIPVKKGLPVFTLSCTPMKQAIMLYCVSNSPNQTIAPALGFLDLPVVANSTVSIPAGFVTPTDGYWSGSVYIGFQNVGRTFQTETLTFECAVAPFDSLIKAEETGKLSFPESSVWNPSITASISTDKLESNVAMLCKELAIVKEILMQHIVKDTETDANVNALMRRGSRFARG